MSATPPTSADDAAGTAARRARQAARREAQARSSSTPRTPGTPGSGAGPGAGSPGSGPSGPAGADPAGPTADPTSVSGATSHRSGRELDPDALAALEDERTFLLRSLADLEREHDAGDVDDTDYAALKDDYTARAAGVIRSIEQREVAFAQARPPRNRARIMTWVAVLLIVSVGLGVFVARSSGRRDPGDSVTGDIRQTVRDQLLDARAAYGNAEFVEAIAIYDRILEAQPANAEALTYKGWLLYLTSRQTTDAADTQILTARSKELLDQAIEFEPAYGDARVFRASVLGALGRPVDGLADLDAVPPGALPAEMSGRVDQLRSDLEAAAAGPTTSVPAATG